MTNERMLEDLANLLKEENNWVKGYFPLTCGVYTLKKDGLKFTVCRLSVSGVYLLSIIGKGVTDGSFEGWPVKSLYDSLVEKCGEVDVENLNKGRKKTALELALEKLRGE